MATLLQVKNRVDAWLVGIWPTVQARQDAYFVAHGRYWQGLITATNIPNHLTGGFADAIADKLSNHPTDIASTWLDVLPEINGVAIPAAFVIDAYQSPAGHGYVATVIGALNGTVYSRSQNVGPLTDRTQAWAQVGT